ncbi:Cellulase (glycosyl hydrolase family 5) [Thermomonospora echinospora]|uniref:Cellulase (Glycosyl hydrolase family 5) n=1 Tax=Thermomonospora echinospora TaxID=1992 RepID=A0A1H6B2Q6_9ACTN|nr:cellulase family glycosylhydrolase [Thermomonospora echinospora]SEG55143.1 Cellulase (glycosyl hydrolase family 5) [Thermomonospora echinospora]
MKPLPPHAAHLRGLLRTAPKPKRRTGRRAAQARTRPRTGGTGRAGAARVLLVLSLTAASGLAALGGRPAADAAPLPAGLAAAGQQALTVAPKQRDWVFRDQAGREVTLRGFNVSGSAKLYENGLLPFRNAADAARSAQAMRDLTGANAIRFLITWEGVQPAPDRIDHAYLDRAVEQIRAFTDRGFYVLLDYHQDLYSAHLFNSGSWYTGDGAPKWAVENGGYPKESCGICLLWGQNMMSNEAVRKAAYDFWRNREMPTSAGPVRVQDAYVQQATAAMTHLRQKLTAQEFQAIIGLDPFNEPFDGGLDGGSGTDWERTRLLPFYQRMRAAMDAAGWTAKPAFVEPLPFWNTGFFEQGGLSSVGALGTRYVFNSHFYDGARMTIDPTPAGDGVYDAAMNEIRGRARTLATAPFVSEFGNRMSGTGSGRTPWMVRAMYQAMDYGVSGRTWWTAAASGGNVLSSTHWHWDVYSGRHRELMNGNPDKVRTEGDAWNDEDFSVVRADDTGKVVLRLDQRVLDRLYPTAVAGDALAFAYEDLARSGYGGQGQQTPWLAVPSDLPNVAALIKDRQFGVLVWRTPATAPAAPTELHLPASFDPARTAVVSDIATLNGLPAAGPIRTAQEPGSPSARRLLIDPAAAGTVRVALVVNAATGPAVTPDRLTAARTELTAWANARFPG